MVLKPCLLYQSISRVNSTFLSGSNEFTCPVCKKGKLQYRDHCKRISRSEGGTSTWFWIPRCRCDNGGCRKITRMLPDFMTPNKHYRTDVISGVLEDIISPDDSDSEDYPTERTMERWKAWLQANIALIEALLRRYNSGHPIFRSEQLEESGSLLQKLKDNNQNWLEKVLRLVYSTGNRMNPVR